MGKSRDQDQTCPNCVRPLTHYTDAVGCESDNCEWIEHDEMVGRQRLVDWQHENLVNDNIRRMDNHR